MLEKIKYSIKYLGAVLFLALMTGGPFIIALYVEALKG